MRHSANIYSGLTLDAPNETGRIQVPRQARTPRWTPKSTPELTMNFNRASNDRATQIVSFHDLLCSVPSSLSAAAANLLGLTGGAESGQPGAWSRWLPELRSPAAR